MAIVLTRPNTLYFRVTAGNMFCGTLRVMCYPNGSKYQLFFPINASPYHAQDAIAKVKSYRKLNLQRIDPLAAWA